MLNVHNTRSPLGLVLVAALTIVGLGRARADDIAKTSSLPNAASPANTASLPNTKADELFRIGKERLSANDFGLACPSLAESHKLDPATGTLLALALCHERQGKLGSAVRDYSEVIVRSRSENRTDREQAALARIAALQSKVSTLTVYSELDPTALSIRINDALLSREQLGRPLPMDGGLLLVEAETPGKVPWQKHLTIADSGAALTVTVPALVPSPASAASAPARKVAAPLPRARPIKQAKFSATERAGIALLSAGGAGFVLSAAYTIRASRQDAKSNKNCVDDLCTPKGREDRLNAREAGDVATISVMVATAVSAGGLIAYLVGRKRHRDAPRDSSRTLRAAGFLAPHVYGASVAGAF